MLLKWKMPCSAATAWPPAPYRATFVRNDASGSPVVHPPLTLALASPSVATFGSLPTTAVLWLTALCRARLRRLARPSAATPPLELLNMPRDADALAEARRRLVDAGFWVSRTLSPQDLAFEDLLEAATRAPLV